MSHFGSIRFYILFCSPILYPFYSFTNSSIFALPWAFLISLFYRGSGTIIKCTSLYVLFFSHSFISLYLLCCCLYSLLFLRLRPFPHWRLILFLYRSFSFGLEEKGFEAHEIPHHLSYLVSPIIHYNHFRFVIIPTERGNTVFYFAQSGMSLLFHLNLALFSKIYHFDMTF